MRSTTKATAKKGTPPAPKKRRGDKIARVRKHADGVVSVLADDPVFYEQLTDAINGAVPKHVQRALEPIHEVVATMQRAFTAWQSDVSAAKAHREGIPTTEQMEARGWLYDEMLKHGPAPTEAEIADAFSSWR